MLQTEHQTIMGIKDDNFLVKIILNFNNLLVKTSFRDILVILSNGLLLTLLLRLFDGVLLKNARFQLKLSKNVSAIKRKVA